MNVNMVSFQKYQTQDQIICNRHNQNSRNVVKPTKKKIISFKNEVMQYYDNNGYLSWSLKKKKYIILGTNSPTKGISKCPECNIGKLMIIRSPKTKKRFIGCSNYYNGCKASSPLLQRAMIRIIKQQCKICAWPITTFRYSRKNKWSKQCTNIRCESRNTKT